MSAITLDLALQAAMAGIQLYRTIRDQHAAAGTPIPGALDDAALINLLRGDSQALQRESAARIERLKAMQAAQPPAPAEPPAPGPAPES